MIKKPALAIAAIVLSVKGLSQNRPIPPNNRDSLNAPKRAVTYNADKFATTRMFNFEFIHVAPYHFTADKGEKSLPESKVNSITQMKANANFYFIKKKTWMLGMTLGYRYTSAETDLTNPDNLTDKVRIDEDFHYLSSSLNFTYFSSLFKKRMVYYSSFMVDGSEQHFERIKGILTATMILKANRQTRLMAGILVNIDPSAQTPFIPTFTYEHKFNNGLIADIIFPRSLYLRKFVFNRTGRISLGTELDRTSFYLYNIDGTDQKYEYRQLDLNNGIVYEHAIGDLMLTARTGYKLTTSGRLFRKEGSFADPVYQAKPDPTFYINVGASFNPFTIFGKHK